MTDIHSKDFQKRYKKSKFKVKQWEDKFVADNGRLPTKVDIKASPASVKEYYKQYWKLKTQILEAQILGESSLKDTSIKTKSDSILKDQANNLNSSEKNEKVSVKRQNVDKGLSELKENACGSETSTKVWGAHLNKNQITSTEKGKCNILSDTIVKKLFQGTTFKKRNPRKALSFVKQKSNKSFQSEEGNNSFKSFESPVLSPCSDAVNASSQDKFFSDTSLDDLSFSVEKNCSPNIKSLISSTSSLSSFLNKKEPEVGMNLNAANSMQCVNSIKLLASDPFFPLKQIRSLDEGWVERCFESENVEKRKSSLDSGFESLDQSLPDLRDDNKDFESSEDDIIAGSDNELNENSSQNCRIFAQKRKIESSPVQEVSCQNSEQSGIESTADKPVTKKRKLNFDECTEDVKSETKKIAKLEKKIQSGTLNENYVKINLKKKIFVRGKKHFSIEKYKKREWKNKKKNLDNEQETGGVVQCYRCGQSGHFSRNCQKSAEDKLLEIDDEEDDNLPTLKEAEQMAREKAEQKQFNRKNTLRCEKENSEKQTFAKVEPLYKDETSLTETPNEVYEALEKFGHSEFRPGQEETIMRILRGQSTLLTIATGGGKSLCYQLPAYLYAKRSKCITLVVSPLVSLMEDQVASSSSFFKVGCLHTSQTQKQREAVLEDAEKGKLFALLVSPETVVSGDSFTSFGSLMQKLPPIAFACIDEVHCVSQWSHNFRPSYLMLHKVMREKLGVTTILGLTATATSSTITSITKELGIFDKQGVIKDIPLPDNLVLTVSRDENKDKALLCLLASERFKDANAILIYCTRRDECERVAVLIRTAFQNSFKEEQRISKRLSWNAESYHAGMAAARRRQVQKAFMRGNLRIVVATVAFGMGINKQDIRGVIHYNMPKDFESYVQEVGRAGRDGKSAHCHLFLDSNGGDLNELRRHIHSNSVDRHVLRKLLQKVFIECDCKKKDEGKECGGHEIAFDCNETIQVLDIPEENIYTLLCYLELHPKKFVKVLSSVYINCQIKSYKGKKAIVAAANKCPPLAYACALHSQKKKEKWDVLEFNLFELAYKMAWDSALVKSQLKSIEWENTPDLKWKKTGISVSFSDLGFRVCSRGDLTPSELDEALDYLIQRVEDQEKRSMKQLGISFNTFEHFSAKNYISALEDLNESNSNGLKEAVRKYFETEELLSEIPLKKLQFENFDEDALAADIRILLSVHRDNNFNGRAVARIFHGIQSPNYPSSLWFKSRFWRKHIDKDFKKISLIATREILRLKM